MTEEQLKIVDYYLGTDYFKSPQKLRQQCFYAELLHGINAILYNTSETMGTRMLKQTMAWLLKLCKRKRQEIG